MLNTPFYSIYASHAKEIKVSKEVQIITGAIVSVLTLYNIASAKAIAPAGPAEFSNRRSFQRIGCSPNVRNRLTVSGRPNNLIIETP